MNEVHFSKSSQCRSSRVIKEYDTFKKSYPKRLINLPFLFSWWCWGLTPGPCTARQALCHWDLFPALINSSKSSGLYLKDNGELVKDLNGKMICSAKESLSTCFWIGCSSLQNLNISSTTTRGIKYKNNFNFKHSGEPKKPKLRDVLVHIHKRGWERGAYCN